MSDADLSSLRAYLAERDVACPGCGYNLRGAQDDVCPECGGPVELSVGGSHRGRGYLIFLLVVFAWVAATAGMSTTREVRAALAQSRVVRGQFMAFTGGVSLSIGGSTTLNGRSVTVNGTPIRSSAPVTINGTTITTQPATPIAGGTSWRTSGPNGLTVTRSPGGMTVTPAPAAGPTRVWGQVGWPTWLGLGWWGVLGVSALAGLMVVLARRRRIAREGPGAILFRGALALIVLQVGFQVFVFVRELGA